MTRSEAHGLLNAARVGLSIASSDILAALVVTGDVSRQDAGDWSVQRVRPAGAWETPRAGALLVPAAPFDGLVA